MSRCRREKIHGYQEVQVQRLQPVLELSSIPAETSTIPDSLLGNETSVVGEVRHFEGPISRDRMAEKADLQGESVETAIELDPYLETWTNLRAATSPVVPVIGQPFVVPSRHIQ